MQQKSAEEQNEMLQVMSMLLAKLGGHAVITAEKAMNPILRECALEIVYTMEGITVRHVKLTKELSDEIERKGT